MNNNNKNPLEKSGVDIQGLLSAQKQRCHNDISPSNGYPWVFLLVAIWTRGPIAYSLSPLVSRQLFWLSRKPGYPYH